MGPCFECGEPAIHRHHVVPKSLGGTKTVPLCHRCHCKVHGDHLSHPALIRAGQAVARANGVRFGRPAGTGKRVKVTAEQEAAIGRLRSEGTAVAAIARATGLSRPTVYDVLRRTPAAAGAGPGAPADVAGGR